MYRTVTTEQQQMEILAARGAPGQAVDPSSDTSRSVHADAVAMARRDVGRGVVAIAGLIAVGSSVWLSIPLLLIPALAASVWTIRSVVRLIALGRADPATWLAAETRVLERESAERAAHVARADMWPVVTLTIAGLVIAVTVIEWWVGVMRAIEVAALVKPATRNGEWWRLVSASYLHISFGHLAGNIFGLVMLGRLVEMYDGCLRVALVYFVSVLGCSLASLWISPFTALGASGGVIGLAGYLLVVVGRSQSQAPRFLRMPLMGVFLQIIASGLIGYLLGGIDNAGHAGGIAAGALVGLVVLALNHKAGGLRTLSGVSRLAAVAIFVAAVFTGVRLLAHQSWPVRGLDHVPVAVNDLDAAAERFRGLGFTLKPGRPHDDGIVNQHAKFPDGTEIELITAPEARDELTRTYREHLAKGDGPAFLALFAPERTAEVVRTERELPLYIFFGPRNASPTDRPEYFQHANTAESLVAVWLAGADFSRERNLFLSLGAELTEEVRDAPTPTRVTVAKFPEGQVLMMPADRALVPGRPVIGVSVRVKSLDFILGLHIPDMHVVTKQKRIVSAFVPPARANGLWIEFWAPGSQP
jgi:membrane associated rhomboid family serine protease/catechol 2,3-dioxygenase-like lactoylglutathione lyase family enzyme